jgi:competence protein ComEA
MSFLEEVDSIESKLGFRRVNPIALIGIGLVALLAVGAIVWCAWGAFTAPGVVLSKGSTDQSQQTETAEQEQAQTKVFVHVVGAVSQPGMVELVQGARIQDAVTAAGGFTEDADQLSVNLARVVTDGEQIVIGSLNADSAASNASAGSSSSGSTANGSSNVSSNGKVNINTATSEQLCTLSGVGESTAAKIIAYRQQNGSFSSIEDLKNVSGIGDKKFAAIKDSITV